MRAVDQLKLDEGQRHNDDTEFFPSKNAANVVSAAPSTPFARLRLVQKSKSPPKYEWTYQVVPTPKTYLHPLINTKIVSEALEDITEAYLEHQFEGLHVFLMESVRVEGNLAS